MHNSNRVLLAMFTIVFILTSFDAAAITRTVTSSANAGAGTLRQAVLDASDNDVIVFDASISTITLTSEIQLNKTLTIEGPNADLLTISGGSTSRIFLVNGAGRTVTLRGMRLLNGRSQATPVFNAIVGGGAIYQTEGTLNIDECEFEGNVSDDGNGSTTFGYGGAIVSHSEINVSNTLFYNNSLNTSNAFGGGAVYVREKTVDHDATFNNCTFFSNSVTGGNGAALGGGMYVADNSSSGSSGPIVSIINCTFYDNNSDNNGEHLGLFSAGNLELNFSNNIFDQSATTGSDRSVECACGGGVSFDTEGGNIYWDSPDSEISTSGTNDLVSQGINGAGLTGTLGLNGGGLRTIAVSSSASLAVNNGISGGLILARDARDFTRTGDPDAGAFEFQGQFNALTLSPADDAIDVPEDSDLILNFEHNVDVSSGNITIHRASNGAILETISVSGAQVSGDGTRSITINPVSDLPSGTEIYVNYPANILTAPRDELITELTGSTSWSFTTTGLSVSLPVTALAFSTTDGGAQEGWNPGDASGLGNRFILRSNANPDRATANIDVLSGTFDVNGDPATPTSTIPAEMTIFTGFGNTSIIDGTTDHDPTYSTTASSTFNNVRISHRGPYARGANVSISTTAGGSIDAASTTVSVTLLLPKAVQLGLQTSNGNTSGPQTAGIGVSGFNGGVTTVLSGDNVNVDLSTFDAFNYITATGNQTFPIFFFTTGVSVSVDNPSVIVSNNTGFSFSPIKVTDSGSMTFISTLSTPTTAIVTFTNVGNSLQSTSVEITVLPAAQFLAVSDQNTGGVDQFNGGDLTIDNQEIVNFNFGTFSNSTTLQPTSATVYASNPDRYGSATMRILDSPFPSNPAVKPTLVGVGGAWAAGPIVTSTHAAVRLSSSNSIVSGVVQFAWFGSTPTTMTLRITSGAGAEEGLGSLVATEITVTINPSPPNRIAFSDNDATGQDGFNINDQGGLGNRFILQVGANANRESSDINSDLGTFSASGNPSAVTSPVTTEYSLFTGFGGASIASAGPTFVPGAATTSNTMRVRMNNAFARGANLGLAPISTTSGLSATQISVTILLPKATQIGLSSTNGNVNGPPGDFIGIDGFNGGVTSLPASTTVNITLSSYDNANYLTATGNNSFPIVFAPTTVTASVDNPNVTLGGTTSFNLSQIAASVSGLMTIDYNGSVATTAVITFTHGGSGDLGTTSVSIQLAPDMRARFMAVSDEDTGGVNQFNGGDLTVDNQEIVTFNFGTFSNSTTLQATSASAYAMNIDRYGSATMRILGSPFPSNPAVKPTIVGVGGAWAAGPSVSSTHAAIRLSSSNSIVGGVSDSVCLVGFDVDDNDITHHQRCRFRGGAWQFKRNRDHGNG